MTLVYMTNDLVNDYNCRIRAESAPNRGATFFFRIE
jgi:hypothetical protein